MLQWGITCCYWSKKYKDRVSIIKNGARVRKLSTSPEDKKSTNPVVQVVVENGFLEMDQHFKQSKYGLQPDQTDYAGNVQSYH